MEGLQASGGSGFLKNDISFSILVISVSFWTPQAWNGGGAGLRRVRILKNNISFFILMISVIFSTPQAWKGGGAGLRRVRILKTDMSWNEKSKLLRDARNADNSRNPPAPRPNSHLGRDKPVVETPHWDLLMCPVKMLSRNVAWYKVHPPPNDGELFPSGWQ